MISFPFLPLYSENLGFVKRPFAEIILHGPSEKIKVNMLVDSGADVSVISYKRGIRLGLKIKENEPIFTLGGISGGIPVVYRNLQMEIGEHKFDARVAWSLSEEIPEIPGRLSVFDEFNIELKQVEGISIFRRRHKKSR